MKPGQISIIFGLSSTPSFLINRWSHRMKLHKTNSWAIAGSTCQLRRQWRRACTQTQARLWSDARVHFTNESLAGNQRERGGRRPGMWFVSLYPFFGGTDRMRNKHDRPSSPLTSSKQGGNVEPALLMRWFVCSGQTDAQWVIKKAPNAYRGGWLLINFSITTDA